ncbi:MAG: AmmeMemoRadiSam system radical SAM enzyme [Nanoarchaeota archaeon]
MEKTARFFDSKDDDSQTVICTACAFNCQIQPKYTGICGVRRNQSGTLINDTYALIAAINIDPIEKKPLYHFLPGKPVLSLGTVGCNFDCDFCQNASLSQCTKTTDNPKNVIENNSRELSSQEAITLCKEHDIPIIAYTYNEPVINVEYVLDTAKHAKENSIRNVMVTNGYHSKQSREALALVIDAVNIDLKSFSPDFYATHIKAKLQPVLDTIRYYHEHGVWVEVTTLLIPGKNDSEKELQNIASFIASIDKDIPWHVSAFHPHHRMSDLSPTRPEQLEKAFRIGKEAGLNHIYLGNIYDPDRSMTICPSCGAKVIGRQPGLDGSVDGVCPECGYEIEGVWN